MSVIMRTKNLHCTFYGQSKGKVPPCVEICAQETTDVSLLPGINGN